MTARRVGLVGVLLALLVPVSAARAASIWTPVNSGTTDTISSVVYQSPTRFWYATTNGKIEYWNGSAFVAGTGITSPENFMDLAFQPSGSWGYAVAANGDVLQTSDAGVSWTKLPALTTYSNSPTDCSSTTHVPVTELNAVVWADSSTAYLMGNNGTLEKSSAAASATPGFTEINKNGSTTCQAQSDGSDQNLTDATFLSSNPVGGLFITQEFGTLFASSNGFTSGNRVSSDLVNNFQGNPRIAQDAGNPNRIWEVDHQPGGGGCGVLCLVYSSDGGLNRTAATFPNDASPSVGLYDISSQGGTEVAAGSGGEIFTSVDGLNFYNQPADGALATENWRAEDAYDAAHAAVGGVGGALAITGAANTIPDIVAPTGTISGPTSVVSGQAVTYTASVADNAGGSGINPNGFTWTVAGFPAEHGATATYTFPRGTGYTTIHLTFSDNAGNQATATLNVTVNDASPPQAMPPSGSQPTTASTGGARITIYKVVFVTHRSARYVPVVVSASKGRKFVVQILPLKGRHVLATGGLTLKHGGHGVIKVGLPATVKPGGYFVVVRESTLKGRHIGRQLKFRFTLV